MLPSGCYVLAMMLLRLAPTEHPRKTTTIRIFSLRRKHPVYKRIKVADRSIIAKLSASGLEQLSLNYNRFRKIARFIYAVAT